MIEESSRNKRLIDFVCNGPQLANISSKGVNSQEKYSFERWERVSEPAGATERRKDQIFAIYILLRHYEPQCLLLENTVVDLP